MCGRLAFGVWRSAFGVSASDVDGVDGGRKELNRFARIRGRFYRVDLRPSAVWVLIYPGEGGRTIRFCDAAVSRFKPRSRRCGYQVS